MGIHECQGTPWNEELDGEELHEAFGGEYDLEPRGSAFFMCKYGIRGSTIGEGGDTTISSPGRSPKQPLSGIGLHVISYMVGKLAPNPLHLTRRLVKYVLGRNYLRAVSSQNGDKFVTSPPPPQSFKAGFKGGGIVA